MCISLTNETSFLLGMACSRNSLSGSTKSKNICGDFLNSSAFQMSMYIRVVEWEPLVRSSAFGEGSF